MLVDGLFEAIRNHIETAAFLSPGELTQEEPLFSSGLIDSVNLLDLILFVEELCGLRVPAQEITLEHWDSLQRILAYVDAKTARQ